MFASLLKTVSKVLMVLSAVMVVPAAVVLTLGILVWIAAEEIQYEARRHSYFDSKRGS